MKIKIYINNKSSTLLWVFLNYSVLFYITLQKRINEKILMNDIYILMYFSFKKIIMTLTTKSNNKNIIIIIIIFILILLKKIEII